MRVQPVVRARHADRTTTAKSELRKQPGLLAHILADNLRNLADLYVGDKDPDDNNDNEDLT